MRSVILVSRGSFNQFKRIVFDFLKENVPATLGLPSDSDTLMCSGSAPCDRAEVATSGARRGGDLSGDVFCLRFLLIANLAPASVGQIGSSHGSRLLE